MYAGNLITIELFMGSMMCIIKAYGSYNYFVIKTNTIPCETG